jgi:hypothetical protein
MTTLTILKRALDNHEYSSAARLVDANPTLLTQLENNSSLLDFYVRRSNSREILEWICSKLVEYKLPVDNFDDHKFTTTQVAYLNNWETPVRTLLPFTAQPNLRQWLAQRQLVCILGAKFLLDLNIRVDSNVVRGAEGGQTRESAHVLLSAVSYLLGNQSRYEQIKQAMHDFYQHSLSKSRAICFDIKRKVQQAHKPRVIFGSGYKGHAIIVSVKQQDNGNYQFTFYDSNTPELAGDFKSKARLFFNGDIAVVRRIEIPANQLKPTIEQLLKNANDDAQVVDQWFASLPKKYNTEYQYDQNILTNIENQEKNRCYWENSRFAIYDLFVDQFGANQGTQEFNALMSDINLKLVENFKKEFASQYNQDAISRIEKALHNKFNQPSLTSDILKYTAIGVAFIIGATLVAASIFSPIGIPTVFTLFTAAPLGLAGVIASFSAGLFLMLAQIVVPAMVKFVAAYTNGQIDQLGSEDAEIDLVFENEVQKNNAKLFPSNVHVKALLAADAKHQQEEKNVIVPAPVAKTKSTFSLKGVRSFFSSSKSKKEDKPAAKPTPVTVTKVDTLRDDLKNLWPLPSTALASRAH